MACVPLRQLHCIRMSDVEQHDKVSCAHKLDATEGKAQVVACIHETVAEV